MNRERLGILVTLLDEVAAGTWVPTHTCSFPELRQKRGMGKVAFDMGAWGSPRLDSDPNPATCGFAACAIGHAILDDRLPELTSRSKVVLLPQLSSDEEGAPYDPWRAIADYFDVTDEQARILFDGYAYPGDNATPRQVAQRVHQLMKDAL